MQDAMAMISSFVREECSKDAAFDPTERQKRRPLFVAQAAVKSRLGLGCSAPGPLGEALEVVDSFPSDERLECALDLIHSMSHLFTEDHD